eukprot:4217976-Prymnesium_polylepis.3
MSSWNDQGDRPAGDAQLEPDAAAGAPRLPRGAGPGEARARPARLRRRRAHGGAVSLRRCQVLGCPRDGLPPPRARHASEHVRRVRGAHGSSPGAPHRPHALTGSSHRLTRVLGVAGGAQCERDRAHYGGGDAQHQRGRWRQEDEGDPREELARVLAQRVVQGPARLPAVGDAAARCAQGGVRRAAGHLPPLLRPLGLRLRLDRLRDQAGADGDDDPRQGRRALHQGVQSQRPHAPLCGPRQRGRGCGAVGRARPSQAAAQSHRAHPARRPVAVGPRGEAQGRGGEERRDAAHLLRVHQLPRARRLLARQPAVGLQVQQEGPHARARVCGAAAQERGAAQGEAVRQPPRYHPARQPHAEHTLLPTHRSAHARAHARGSSECAHASCARARPHLLPRVRELTDAPCAPAADLPCAHAAQAVLGEYREKLQIWVRPILRSLRRTDCPDPQMTYKLWLDLMDGPGGSGVDGGKSRRSQFACPKMVGEWALEQESQITGDER